MIKNNRKIPEPFTASYTHISSFGKQYIYIKYADDVKAIDCLLKQNFERQAIYIADQPCNKIENI